MKFLVLAAVVLMLASSEVSSASICPNPGKYAGQSLCDPWGTYCGECVSFIKVCTGDHRPTGQWSKGSHVKEATGLAYGTAIATFPNGAYSGHAAIYEGKNAEGIQVYDQWVGHPVSRRTIRYGGSGISNDGNQFYVIG